LGRRKASPGKVTCHLFLTIIPITGWVLLEADSETEITYTMLTNISSWDRYFWKEREGSRTGQREQSSYWEGLMTALADTVGVPAVKMLHQNCLESG
jgi:hypothetical protein